MVNFADIFNKGPYREEGWRALTYLGYFKAEVHFSGGNDQGAVDSIKVWDEKGEEHSIDPWYPDYFSFEETSKGRKLVPNITPGAPLEKLAALLQRPVEDEYGSFAGDFYVDGVVTWDRREHTITMEKDLDETVTRHERYDVI